MLKKIIIWLILTTLFVHAIETTKVYKVHTENGVTIDTFELNTTYSENVILESGTLVVSGEATVLGNFNVSGGTLNLQEGNLTIEENLTQRAGVLKVNGGRLEVKGDYRIQTPQEDGSYRYSWGKVQMTNSNDYILVHGDFVMDSYYRHDGYNNNDAKLSDGVLEIKGNFTQLSTYSNEYRYRTYVTPK